MKQIVVSKIPECSFCGAPAKYDCKSKVGTWAYMCSSCFSVYGTEMGSELVEKSKFTPKKVGLEEIIEEAMMEDLIHCPKCGEALEMDAERCSCGWKNPLLALGLI